jgi:hypothetical protein
MPVRFVIHKEQRLVITTGEGRLTFDEVKAHQDRLLNDPDFDPDFNQLLDATAVTTMVASEAQVRTVAERKLFSPTSRRAFVVASTFTYGMGRMLQTYNEMSDAASPISIFGDRASALKWLGIAEKFQNDY